MKKIINSPETFVDEVIDGILLAHPDQLRAASADQRALVRTSAGAGSVGIVTGGGSGHLPFFLGYVGEGLASGVAVGNVFSSPSPEQIHAATMASDSGGGVLYLYGNYGGDVYNFDIAADLAAAEGVRTTTVLGTDDILSAPPEKAATRRGVAGLIFAYKTAGAAAARGEDLDAVTRVAQHTVDRTRTMGVGLSPTILPAAGEPTFTLDDGEMEVGIGIHGEPGQHRGPLETADEITDRFLTEILGELGLTEGDRVALLVNGLGATPLEELYLIYRRAHRVLQERGIAVHRRYVGEYATSLEMAGASLSVLHLDEQLTELIDAPARSPFFSQGSASPGRAPATDPEPTAATPPESGATAAGPAAVRRSPAPGRLREVLLNAVARWPQHAEELRRLDAAVGDGDLGVTVSTGAEAVRSAVGALPEDAHPAEVVRVAGSAFAGGNPSTYAALMGGGLVNASLALAEHDRFGRAEAALLARRLLHRIQERGGAQVGDKTVVDVLSPVLETLESASTEHASAQSLLDLLVERASEAVHEGAARQSQRGRASWLGERSIGQQDPGSVALLRLLEEVRAAL
ncbi:dihydroxyacetone kinase family protein [Ornithinicoccus halotolerans]|uniref:dihydroxyacetone kinase family protein n=1 Tax=Ornithinicoccus halotolerans TaxID=1748220 RepID=UPI001294EC76|nr:dihydroxyacetone kinase family protein [Ornithinicoccus halotolerans]